MIDVVNVTKKFQDRKKSTTAVDHVSFHVGKGRIVGLVGENGAGKTTILRSIATLVSQDEGTISVAGYDTLKQAEEVKNHIGVLFGGETGLYDRLTARENLLYFGGLYGLPKHTLKNRIDDLSQRFGMRKELDRTVGGFSRGMRQKVAIARAVIHDPEVILFDEPTTGLDITSANVFRDFTRQLQKEGKTIIFSSHIMDEVRSLSDDLILMHQGQLLYSGTAEALYEKEGTDDLNYIFMSNIVRGETYV
ncbi:ATP-binding cassette domain-containing protein [Listeria welshimeri]|uniref:ABC transporter ATP-binding protein n=1 Tax=Listeria welshimeri TaxID=1643 RepID=A0A7X0W524_LISWE|nr:ATP-binding cassette domain-containing protein [Listeria welshimeri]MBC1242793.1 ATP-binding cassette domain-containing protein [Listeria welshimeri]MBC1249716.1 ATP-binding cassette domain-containing protein [Listeria welshimeri]MBC1251275.1 ATP-binding cassette domain-containing protein [Listeria welshimeri]MBC1282336.1 ATP-binding cassette domain-containing protein [Listeria welshimeri]MBC1318935.1 ATP-binding cassette domain-containing protein [Listeria welshimeri]